MRVREQNVCQSGRIQSTLSNVCDDFFNSQAEARIHECEAAVVIDKVAVAIKHVTECELLGSNQVYIFANLHFAPSSHRWVRRGCQRTPNITSEIGRAHV